MLKAWVKSPESVRQEGDQVWSLRYGFRRRWRSKTWGNGSFYVCAGAPESAIPLWGPRLTTNPFWTPTPRPDRSKPQYDSRPIPLGYFPFLTFSCSNPGIHKVLFIFYSSGKQIFNSYDVENMIYTILQDSRLVHLYSYSPSLGTYIVQYSGLRLCYMDWVETNLRNDQQKYNRIQNWQSFSHGCQGYLLTHHDTEIRSLGKGKKIS